MTDNVPKKGIWFKGLKWPPLKRLEGGTAVQETWSSAYANAIGVIFTRSVESQDDANPGKEMEWVYVPNVSTFGILTSEVSLEDLQSKIRHRIENPPVEIQKPKKRWIRICSADIDEAGGALLEWSKLGEVWEESGIADHYSFVRDIVGSCVEVDVFKKYRAGGLPSHCGTEVVVRTQEPEKLRLEIAAMIQTFVESHRELEELNARRAAEKRERRANKSKPSERPSRKRKSSEGK